MKKLHFPSSFEHLHPPIRDVNEIVEEQLTVGQRASDWVATSIGSWKFIISQSIILVIWVILNVTAVIKHWDPYPFILMNLVMSLQAAFTAPVLMMSQNRQATKDRIEAHNDFMINQKTEEEVRAILDHLVAQDEALTHIYQMLSDLQVHLDPIE